MFKTVIKTAIVAIALVSSSVSFASPLRNRVIAASGKLNMTAAMVSKFGQSQGNFAIEAGAQNISQFANQVEVAARFGTKMEAQMAVNMVIMEYISIRTEFLNLPNHAQANMVRLTLRNSINNLVPLLGQPVLSCGPVNDGDCNEPDQIQVGGEWDDAATGNGGGHTGGGHGGGNGGWGNIGGGNGW